MFPHFRESAELFEECSRFWEAMSARVTSALGAEVLWQRDMYSYVNSPLPLDMRVAYGARSFPLRRRLRIDQYSPAINDDEGLLEGIMKELPAEDDAPPPDTLLALPVLLTEETAALAERVLSIWMDPRIPTSEMLALIQAAGVEVSDERASRRRA